MLVINMLWEISLLYIKNNRRTINGIFPKITCQFTAFCFILPRRRIYAEADNTKIMQGKGVLSKVIDL
jgi:hypothetical protein